jgi:hypothetical protein
MRWKFAIAAIAAALVGLVAANASAASLVGGSYASRATAGVGSQPITTPHLPPPPDKLGCYRYTNGGWRRIACASQAFIKSHFPHPEVLSGVSGTTKLISGKKKTAAPFALSVISAQNIDQQFGGETDTKFGANAASLQNNEFFVGNNKVEDGVQFTDQSAPTAFGELNGVCVWQIDIKTQKYTSNCASVLFNDSINLVEGVDWDGILTVAAASDGNGSAIAVNVPDIYGLGVGHRWNNSSGGLLGYGNGSESVWTNTEEAMAVEVSDCPNDAGFIQYSVFCHSGALKPLSYTSYSPGPSTNNYETLETNNLIPVIGNPPAHLPPLAYFGSHVAQINYTATTTGHCWTGTLPYCT